ncbi:hypothetical protein [Aeromicrobium sp. P5_D10]
MARERIVVGSIGADEAVRTYARQLRDQGREVVFVGGGQSPEHLLSTAIAEDAVQIVVDGDAAALGRLGELCARLGADAPLVVDWRADGCDVTNAPETTEPV